MIPAFKQGAVHPPVEMPSEQEILQELKRLRYLRDYRRAMRTTVCALLIVLTISLLISLLYFTVLQVSGNSMEPTLKKNDLVLFTKGSEAEVGSVIGFYHEDKLLLRRVIGGPGDEIDLDAAGTFYVDGTPLKEAYVLQLAPGYTNISYPYTVPEDQYFVVGDNREVSIDSRNTAIGCVDEEQIMGTAVARVWPLTRIKVF